MFLLTCSFCYFKANPTQAVLLGHSPPFTSIRLLCCFYIMFMRKGNKCSIQFNSIQDPILEIAVFSRIAASSKEVSIFLYNGARSSDRRYKYLSCSVIL